MLLYRSDSWFYDRGDAKSPGRVPPSGIQADHGDDGDTWNGRGVGISPSGGGTVIPGSTPHNRVN